MLLSHELFDFICLGDDSLLALHAPLVCLLFSSVLVLDEHMLDLVLAGEYAINSVRNVFMKDWLALTSFTIKEESTDIRFYLLSSISDRGELRSPGAHILQKYFISSFGGALPFRPLSTTLERLLHAEYPAKDMLYLALKVCGHIPDNLGNDTWQTLAPSLLQLITQHATGMLHGCLASL